MKYAPALALAIALAVVTPAHADAPSAADRTFREQVEQFVQAELLLYPERATHLGDHSFDNRIDDLSAHGIDA
ncbi:MAG TPA: DUF885 domain-containing protein, partial [Patescibacteria group bacterium]|nr:DUF885 domain-containing protein [Patescibacteria group bacterium]